MLLLAFDSLLILGLVAWTLRDTTRPDRRAIATAIGCAIAGSGLLFGTSALALWDYVSGLGILLILRSAQISILLVLARRKSADTGPYTRFRRRLFVATLLLSLVLALALSGSFPVDSRVLLFVHLWTICFSVLYLWMSREAPLLYLLNAARKLFQTVSPANPEQHEAILGHLVSAIRMEGTTEKLAAKNRTKVLDQ